MQGGIWPWRSSDSRSSATTRDECLLLHVTPDQLHNCVESFFFHEGSVPVGSDEAERWCLRQSSASMSSSLGERPRGVAASEGVASSSGEREAKRMSNGSDELRVPTGAICVV
jgi:hypothetical protein